MAIIKSFSPFQDLSTREVQVVDTDPNSLYFRITEFQETFTGGKNGFLIEGSEFLKPSTEVKIELLDVEGNPIFFIPGEGIPEYYEGVSKLVSVHVYEDTPIGQGKITILGELERYIDENGDVREVPDVWKGFYNVKWERTFRVNKNLNNETIVRFVNRPQVQIDEIVKPFFTKEIPQITQTGSASGIGENPIEGTNLDGYTAGTLYRIAITDDSNFTQSVDENIITFTNLGYSSTVREVLNNKEVLVDVPYTENNIVTNFQNQSYTTTFEDLESQSTVESALTGSFAKIRLNRLKTFVGDVARVRIFRKSRNEVGDFQFIQEARIESTELLRDITVQDDTEVFYGNFTQNILDTYWVSGSDDHPISLDDTKLFGGVQVDYNEGIGGTQTFITSESFQIEDDVEYTVSFKTIFDGTPTTDKFVRVSLSGSNYEQVISTTIPSASFNTRQNITQNFIATTSSLDTKLQFEFVGADWYVSKVSLKNAQETSFSPDELTLIQDVPRRLPQETFDFRFDFYDVNNKFIPVSVTATKEFVGGNDFRTEQKLFTFESSQTAFRFITGSLGNPPFQQIRFSNTIQNLTGSVLYTSQAFDIDGNLITSESYHDSGVLEYPGGFTGSYPGLLQNPSNVGALLPIANFSGSVSGVTVGSIIYTASLENRQEFETIFRFEDGEDAPALIVTSNTNQFIYEPTQLRPKPLGQEVRIKAQRKNLASLITPITVNSGSGNPPLTEGVDVNGIKNYSISANTFSASFAGSDGSFPEVTYEFTSSDEFNNEFTDEITVSPVINFDGLSVVLSNESTAFRANSQGLVLDDFESGDGEVEVRIGENVIEHSDGLITRNRFDIISATETNVTAKDTTPNTNEYGITALNGDSGSLVLDIRYLAGDNATSQSFTKKVNYTKNRISPPAILLDVENRVQNRDANSTGQQLTGFTNSDVTIRQIYTGSVKTFGGGDVSFTITSGSNDINGNPLVSVTGTTLSFGNLPDGTDSTTVQIEASLTDSEGGSRTVQDSISLSKSKKAPPNVLITATPQSQTVAANSSGTQTGTLSNVSVSALEGNTSVFDSMSIVSTSGFSVIPTVSGNTLIMSSATMNVLQATVTLQVNFTNSEGQSNSQNITINSALSVEGDKGDDGQDGQDGEDGAPGAPGAPGDDGADGPGIVFRGPWDVSTNYVFNLSNSRRDAVLYDGTYYATLRNTTGDQPDISPSDWESLGTDDFFVAAKIAIFEESFVKNTLNVGTDTGANDANITIAGGRPDPYISLGQADGPQAYNSTGIFIGSNGGNQVLSLVGTGGSLLWDGTDLTINGGGTFSGNLSAAGGTFAGKIEVGGIEIGADVDGTNDGIYFDSNDYWLNNNTFSLGNGNLTWNGSNLTINGGGTFTGTLSGVDGDFSGTITATSGEIAGFEIQSLTITGSQSSVGMDSGTSRGTLRAEGSAKLNAGGQDVYGFYINDYNYFEAVSQDFTGDNGIPVFRVGDGSEYMLMNNGTLTISSTNFQLLNGSITATDGTIGGWSIGSNALTGGGVSLDSSGTISVGNTFEVANNTFRFGNFTSPGGGYSIRNDVLGTPTPGAYYLINEQTVPSTARLLRNAFVHLVDFDGVTASPKTGFYIESTSDSGGVGVLQDVTPIQIIPKRYNSNTSGNELNWFINQSFKFQVDNAGTVSEDAYWQVNGPLKVVGNGGSIPGDITATGNITAFASSDKRLKDNIIPITSSLDKINKLNGYEFEWNDKQKSFEGKDIGLIAQEVQEVYPMLVGEQDTGYLGVKYDKLVPLLVQGIKELHDKVKELETKLNDR